MGTTTLDSITCSSSTKKKEAMNLLPRNVEDDVGNFKRISLRAAVARLLLALATDGTGGVLLSLSCL